MWRKSLALALGLNSAVVVVELIGTLKANSLSLLIDAIHNISDETALILLYLACAKSQDISKSMVRFANLFNSVGILVICGVALIQVVRRLMDPAPMLGFVSIGVGLLCAGLNWGVALALKKPAREDASIRLAYAHNIGDTLVSLGPVVAGILTVATGWFIFDPLVALIVAVTIIVSTIRTMKGSSREMFVLSDPSGPKSVCRKQELAQ